MIKDTTDYTALWKEVERLQNDGKVRSALEIVDSIFTTAESNDNQPQWTQAFIYRNRLNAAVQEEGEAKTILNIENGLSERPEPMKSILHHYLGNFYAGYINQNQYRLQNRTTTIPDDGDITTWSLERLEEKVRFHYSASTEQFHDEPVNDWKSLLQIDEKRNWVTNLGDILHDQAIQFFSSQQNLHAPVQQFILRNIKALADINVFNSERFKSDDPSDYNYIALNIYQKWLKNIESNPELMALVDARRLSFVYGILNLENRDEIYVKGLEENIDRKDIKCPYQYRLAQYYIQQGNLYALEKSAEYQMGYVKAHELLQSIDKNCATPIVAKQAREVIQQLEQEEYSVILPEVMKPGVAWVYNVQYRNISRLYAHIYKIDPKDWNHNYHHRNSWDLPSSAELIDLRELNLPVDKDFQRHSVELIQDELDYGQYMIVVSDQKDLKKADPVHELRPQLFQVTDIATSLIRKQGESDLIVSYRGSGKAITRAEVGLYQVNYSNNKSTRSLKGTFYSDAEGKVTIRGRAYRRTQIVQVQSGKDIFLIGQGIYNYNVPNPTTVEQINLITDRSIYRPGQRVYFQGILHRKTGNEIPVILSGQTVNVFIRDVNNKEIYRQSLRTDEYGVISGSFVLPTNVLTGQFSLRTNPQRGATYYSVEEYKRPTFEATFDELDGDYVTGKEVVVKGTAKNYVGNPLQDAKVTYRIRRATYFPYWRYRMSYDQCFPGFQQNKEVAHGEVKIKEDGTFSIPFIAQGDPNINDKWSAQYHYSVDISVVDATGESHDYTQRVAVGQKSVQLSLERDENLFIDDQIVIKAQNPNGVHKKWTGELTIEKLNTPERILEERLWPAPDKAIHSDGEFRQRVPSHPMQNEADSERWSVKSVLLAQEITTDYTLPLDARRFSAGVYRLTVKGKDTFGKEVELKQIIKINESSELAYDVDFVTKMDTKSYEPGETAILNIYTRSIHPVYVIIDRPYQRLTEKWYTVDKTIQIPITLTESDRGGVYVRLSSTARYDYINKQLKIDVPWKNKQLDVSWINVRDKTLPGSDQKWIMEVKDKYGEPVKASLAASLYDASLDYFKPHSWNHRYFSDYYNNISIQAFGYGQSGYFQNGMFLYAGEYDLSFPAFKYGYNPYYGGGMYRDEAVMLESRVRNKSMPGAPMEEMEADAVQIGDLSRRSMDGVAATAEGVSSDDSNVRSGTANDNPPPSLRKNLQESVFFYPDLHTDKDGRVELDFKMGEALTRWKLLLQGHTKELQLGRNEYELETYKDFMIFPLLPRFLREKDKMVLRAKVVNQSDKTLSITAKLRLSDVLTSESVNQLFTEGDLTQTLSLDAHQSEIVEFSIEVPPVDQLNLVKVQWTAQAGTQGDGEEHLLPVLTNRIRLHESIAMPMRGAGAENWSLAGLQKIASNNKNEIDQLTLELTAHPIWNAILALPYMDDDNESTSSLLYRYYAQSIGALVMSNYPRISEMVRAWKASGEDATVFKSELEKNPELKALLLSQTPWVLDAETEAEQRRRITLFFDLNALAQDQRSTWNKIKSRQNSDGGFQWMPGGHSSHYISREVLEIFGLLKNVDGLNAQLRGEINPILTRAMNYVDQEIYKMYSRTDRKENYLPSHAMHYLYIRSLLPGISENTNAHTEMIDYYLRMTKKLWNKQSLYEQGLIASIWMQKDKPDVYNNILQSIKERSVVHNEIGRYWKNTAGYRWNQRPLITHAHMIRLFEQQGDRVFVNDLKLWLLKNKQTNAWPSSRATTAAVHALVSSGNAWVNATQPMMVEWEHEHFTSDDGIKGLGYLKKELDPEIEIPNTIKTISKSTDPSWAAVHWQYWTDLDQAVVYTNTPLKLSRQLAVVKNTDRGPVATPIDDVNGIVPGDEILVKIILKVDREMDFLHLRDDRASSLEPKEVLSGYRYQDGLVYYQSIKDASADFFIEHARPGTYVFEYSLNATHVGDYSAGLTRIQSFYAPEFSSHSEGARIKIDSER